MLRPEEEAAVREAAEREKVTVAEFVRRAVREAIERERAARLAAIEAATGSMAYLRRDWKETQGERDEQRRFEEERDRRRWPGRGL